MVSDSKSGGAAKQALDVRSRSAAATIATGSRHVFLLSLVLALAYLLTIVYASLQPFRNWRLPAAEVYGFFTAPWPYYITLADVLINVAAYMPLGFMLTLGLRLWLRPLAAVGTGTLIAIALSIAMESVQMFLPTRIASNVDVLANSAGALVGALAAPLFVPAHTIATRVGMLRDQVFVPGALADVGILLILVWAATHLNPWSQVFGPGDLKATFDLPVIWGHTANRLLVAEAVVVALNVIGVGLLLSTLLRVSIGHSVFISAFLVVALALKMLSAWLLGKPQGLWAGLTPGMAAGLVIGVVLLVALLRCSDRARLVIALLSITVAWAAINLVPDNPYFSLPAQLAHGGRSHFLSFWSITRALSELWPLLAISYLAVASMRRRERRLPAEAL